jgi:chemotaxis protein CheY-P-specific phosphatase CheC
VSQDRLLEYAQTGARAAAFALARLLDAELAKPEPGPVCEKLELSALPALLFPGDAGAIGVFVDLVGPVQGEAGIGLLRPSADALVCALVDEADSGRFDSRALSALSEVGNMVLSAAAGAMADLAGGVVIPSVPRVGTTLGELLLLDEICSEIRSLPVFVASCEVVRGNEKFPMRFVWIPGE